MFASFLHPFPVRGQPAPMLWVFYRLVAQYGRDMVFLLSRDYLEPPEAYASAGRWEFSAEGQAALGYRVPSRAQLEGLRVEIVPDRWSDAMRERFGTDALGPWRHLLQARDAGLEAWIADALERQRRQLGEGIDAVFCWNNCAALRAAVCGLGLPLLHWELGPLRAPQFRQTAFLDPQGVNGGTECEARLRAAEASGELSRLPGLSRTRLAAIFCTTPPAESPGPQFELGAPLQLDDDSNLVAYGHGHDNDSLIGQALARCSAPGRLLVRNHPARTRSVPPGGYAIDASAGSLAFIAQCERILTINSGVGAEALLLGKPVEALGDSPYAHIARAAAGSEAQLQALRFFLLCYLVPWPLLFDGDYVHWRLQRPTETGIAARHLATYASGRAGPAATARTPARGR